MRDQVLHLCEITYFVLFSSYEVHFTSFKSNSAVHSKNLERRAVYNGEFSNLKGCTVHPLFLRCGYGGLICHFNEMRSSRKILVGKHLGKWPLVVSWKGPVVVTIQNLDHFVVGMRGGWSSLNMAPGAEEVFNGVVEAYVYATGGLRFLLTEVFNWRFSRKRRRVCDFEQDVWFLAQKMRSNRSGLTVEHGSVRNVDCTVTFLGAFKKFAKSDC